MTIRNTRMLAQVLIVSALSLYSSITLAHHSFAMFDQTKQVQIQGTVKDYQWTQPHVWLDVMVEAKNGQFVRWGIESQSPGILYRRGWRSDSIKAGDKVTVDIFPMKDGTPGGQMLKVNLPDGRVLTTAMGVKPTY